MRWACRRAGRAWLTRTAKSCGPDLPTLGSSLCVTSAQAMVAKKPGTPGRARIRRQTIAQGMPVLRRTCGDCRLLFLLQAGHGCCQRPAFPAPSYFRGTMMMHHSGMFVPRECGVISLSRFKNSAVRPRLKHCGLWNTGSPGPAYAKAPAWPRTRQARRSFSEGGKPGDDIEQAV
jgi:hypothetical protein